MFPRMTPVHTPFLPDETKFARSRTPANQEYYIECPTCRDSFPKSDIEDKCTFSTSEKHSLKNLMPILHKEHCGHTDDGGVQPWMHGLQATVGGGTPDYECSDMTQLPRNYFHASTRTRTNRILSVLARTTTRTTNLALSLR